MLFISCRFSSRYRKIERFESASNVFRWSGFNLKSLNFSRSLVSFSRQFRGQVIWLLILWLSSFCLYEYSMRFSSMSRSLISRSLSLLTRPLSFYANSSDYFNWTISSSFSNIYKFASFFRMSLMLMDVWVPISLVDVLSNLNSLLGSPPHFRTDSSALNLASSCRWSSSVSISSFS